MNQTRQLQCGAVLWAESTYASYALKNNNLWAKACCPVPRYFSSVLPFLGFGYSLDYAQRNSPRAARLSSMSQHSWPVPWAESSGSSIYGVCFWNSLYHVHFHILYNVLALDNMAWSRRFHRFNPFSPAVKNLGLTCKTVFYHTPSLLELEEGEAKHDTASTRHFQ